MKNMESNKRKNYISWDEYFMGVALLSAKRSKDPSSQVGCCIVDEENKIIGIGYNGFPRVINDDDLPWGREGLWINTKYPYVVHAEANALLNSTKSLKNARVYVTLFPCNECAKLLIQSGVKEVIYKDDYHHDEDNAIASRKMLELSGIKTTKMDNISLEDLIK